MIENLNVSQHDSLEPLSVGRFLIRWAIFNLVSLSLFTVCIDSMTPQELQALLALGEGQLIEFKSFGGSVGVTSLAETIVAFANAEGGAILIGVDDNRVITGFSPTTENIDRLLEDISGPLVYCVERGWQAVWKDMRKEARITSLVREEIPEYPPFAVREAIINAMAHRDWRVSGLRNQVRMFDDRIEVVSAGNFPGHVTAENIVHEQFSRNPKIVKVLYHWNYIEELGIGIDRMIRTMKEAGNPSPEFSSNGHSVTITLRSAMPHVPVVIPEAWKEKLNARQMQAITYLKEQGSISTKEYRDLCKIGRTLAKRDIAEMVRQGILIRQKQGKATTYTLSA